MSTATRAVQPSPTSRRVPPRPFPMPSSKGRKAPTGRTPSRTCARLAVSWSGNDLTTFFHHIPPERTITMVGQIWSVATEGGFMYSDELSDTLRQQVQPLTKFRQL